MTVAKYETMLNLAAHPLMWPLVRIARRIAPVWRVPGLGIVVSGAEFAREVLTRDSEFTKNGPGSFAQALTLGLGPKALGNMDGEEHRHMRASLADVLAPERSAALVQGRAAELESMCARLVRGDIVDLADFMRAWSGRIAFDVLGISPPVGKEEEASRDIVRLSGRMASVLGFRRPSAAQVRDALADRERLSVYFRVAYNTPAQPDSLVGRLQRLGLSFDAAAGILLIFVIGGTLTTSAALPRIVALLIDNGLVDRIANESARIPQVVDEGLRFITPLPGTVRIAERDAVVAGRNISAGSRIVILTCNMARDPLLYSHPDQFDIERKHDSRVGRLWFGAGPHRCAGFHLAQRELIAALTALAGTRRNFRVVRRSTTRGALLPAYSELLIQATDELG